MITGHGHNTNPRETIWFCHVCSTSWTGSGYHACHASPEGCSTPSAGKEGGAGQPAEQDQSGQRPQLPDGWETYYRYGEDSVHADILSFLSDLGLEVEDRYTEPINALKHDRDELRKQLGYALDALEGKPWTGWTTDDGRKALSNG